MNTPNAETRPQATGARSETHRIRRNTHPDSKAAAPIPHLSDAEIETSRPLYVLVSKNVHDRITRRVYLSLHAAVNASKRAEMRGQAVSLELCRVVPYLTGRELHGIGGDDA
ncbi:hypothetical protein [Brachybacterium huguangmaarense]